jgi:hypothetical protein
LVGERLMTFGWAAIGRGGTTGTLASREVLGAPISEQIESS